MEKAQEVTATQSPSKISMWASDCQQKWAYIYIHGLRRPPAAALMYGRAWDKTISDGDIGYWAEVLRDGKHLTVNQAREKFASIWDTEAAEVEDWGDDDKGVLLDCGTQGMGLWVPEVAVKHYPHSLQRRFQFGVEDDSGKWSLNGVIDTTLRDLREKQDKAVLHDDKTAKQSWLTKTGPNAGKPSRKATGGLQAAAYTLGVKVDPKLQGEVLHDRLVFDVHVKTKVPQQQAIEVKVTPQEHEDYLRLAGAVRLQQQASIQAGYFVPNRQSNLCSKRWCPFHEECVREHGGEVPD